MIAHVAPPPAADHPGPHRRRTENAPTNEEPPVTTVPTRPPAGRYGPEPSARRRLWARLGLAALVVATLAVLAWLGWGVLRDPVQWRDVGFHVDGASSIEVTFDVTKAPTATVTCRVVGLSQSFGHVGVKDVTVGPGSTRTLRVTVTVPTAETAVSGTVTGCDPVSP